MKVSAGRREPWSLKREDRAAAADAQKRSKKMVLIMSVMKNSGSKPTDWGTSGGVVLRQKRSVTPFVGSVKPLLSQGPTVATHLKGERTSGNPGFRCTYWPDKGRGQHRSTQKRWGGAEKITLALRMEYLKNTGAVSVFFVYSGEGRSLRSRVGGTAGKKRKRCIS